MIPEFLQYFPTVYCVRDKYQIIFITKDAGAGAVIIDGKRYTDNICGVVRSASRVHKIEIKTDILDNAGGYTVELRRMPERLAYHTVTVSTESVYIPFRGVPVSEDINCYIISDTHGNFDEPSEAAKYFGSDIDLLILGGDIGRNVTDEEGLFAVARLSSNIVKGERAVIFMRGNHDTRGAFAEFLPYCVGSDKGKTYFTIRLGRLWFVVLDEGEDKPDSDESYGGTADYADMRNSQIEMLENIINKPHTEYAADGVDICIGLCHTPFTRWESPLFAKWNEQFNKIGIDILLSGHTHRVRYTAPENTPRETLRPDFPVIECAELNRDDLSVYKGTALTIGKDKMTVRFTDKQHNIKEEHVIPIKRG
ncbi:MAG: metallophosphoesterase [Clostridia bacterium]|nr:metallophosphoesterase [Clostridia bacterium]